MTDNEIIEALECCGDPYDICANCPIPNDIKDDCRCGEHLANNALDLINRQQAEIERLQKKVEELSEVLSDSIRIRYKETKSEAVKEFAEKLKEVSSEMVMMCDNGTPISISYSISSKKLDSILKEMVGDKK